MRYHDCSIKDLRINVASRLQCLHGCMHYKRHIYCPPNCPNEAKMRDYLGAYQNLRVCHEKFSYGSNSELKRMIISLHLKLIDEETKLRKEGHHFAMAFTSAPCQSCEDGECHSAHCRRPSLGRMTICATCIDLGHLLIDVLDLKKEDLISFWRGKLSDQHFGSSTGEAFFVGIVLY